MLASHSMYTNLVFLHKIVAASGSVISDVYKEPLKSYNSFTESALPLNVAAPYITNNDDVAYPRSKTNEGNMIRVVLVSLVIVLGFLLLKMSRSMVKVNPIEDENRTIDNCLETIVDAEKIKNALNNKLVESDFGKKCGLFHMSDGFTIDYKHAYRKYMGNI